MGKKLRLSECYQLFIQNITVSINQHQCKSGMCYLWKIVGQSFQSGIIFQNKSTSFDKQKENKQIYTIFSYFHDC